MYRLLVIILFAALTAAPALSQASNSTVRGSVTDAQGAVIPGAKVTLVNTATNVTRESATNGAGLYVFPGTSPGPYRVKIESPGMQPFEGWFIVQVEQDATVDVSMTCATGVTTVKVRDVT